MDPAVATSVDEAPLGTAADLATGRIARASPDDTVATVLGRARAHSYDTFVDVAVCDGDRFVGLVHIDDLLGAPPEVRACDLVDTAAPVVDPEVDEEVAAAAMLRHGSRSLSVVDGAGHLVGLIPPERMLRVLFEHHERDLARLGGFLHEASRARLSSAEPVPRRLWHRLPWLLVGLVGAMASAELLGAFSDQLDRVVALALFIPGIVYLADAVGTQTETLVVRGLSIGVSVRSVLGREALTGVLVGLALAALLAPYLLVTQDDPAVAATVSLALMASCAIATFVAMALPWLFHRLGRDPAFGSGPLATVIQDLASLVVYLALAVVLVG